MFFMRCGCYILFVVVWFCLLLFVVFFFKQKTAYEMRISDWSSDVCSSDLLVVSRINGCVYCASVHAQRFEQLAKRNDTVAQVFDDPRSAGVNERDRKSVV